MEEISLNRKKIFRFSVTTSLIIINIICFFIFLIATAISPKISEYLVLTPSLLISKGYIWTLLTSMFLHASFTHLFFNMISLFYIGKLVEEIVGRKRFLSFYLISGIFAGIFFVLTSLFLSTGIGASIFGSPDIAGVGASGAIFGLIGILVVLIPKKKIYLVAGPIIAIILQTLFDSLITNQALLGILNLIIEIYLLFCIFAVFSFNENIRKLSIPIGISFWLVPIVAIVPLVIVGLFLPLPIANSAHFGGIVAGILYGIYLKKKFKNKTKRLVYYFR